MGSTRGASREVSLDALVKTMIGWAGLAACLALVFLGMRAVMDVGGYCAEGGPYVVSQSCPDGATPALLLGIFLGLASAFLASVGGAGLGGIWAATPVLAWSALFLALGWNFLEYGVFAPPSGAVDLGWLIPGVLFWAMGGVPLAGVLAASRSGSLDGLPGVSTGGGPRGSAGATGATGSTSSPRTTPLPGPGQPARRPLVVSPPPVTRTTPDGVTTTSWSATVVDADLPPADRERLGALADRLSAAAADPTPEERAQLLGIATDFGAAIGAAMAATPVDLAARGEPTPVPGGAVQAGPEPDFTEGTQALLDRLERLADMRASGLLGPDEYETAKAAVMAELEGRS